MVKPKVIFGLSQEISFPVIMWKPESNCTCRLKNHSKFHCNTLTLPRRWMWCRRNILTITGMLMEEETCRIHGQVSRDSFYWMRSHLMDIHGPGGDWQENIRLQDKTMCGQKSGNTCPMHRNAKRSKSGLSRNQSSIMPEDYVVFTSWILKMRNSRTSWKNVRRKLEISMPAAMPCKTSLCRSSRETCRATGGHKT